MPSCSVNIISAVQRKLMKASGSLIPSTRAAPRASKPDQDLGQSTKTTSKIRMMTLLANVVRVEYSMS